MFKSFFKRLQGAIAAIALAVPLGAALPAHSTSVTWTGPSHFDAASIGFTGFTANTLTSVSGSAWFHPHGSITQTMYLDVRLDGIWTQIFTASSNSVSNVPSNTLSSLISNISFATGIVDGLRARSSHHVNQSFHNWGGAQFHFDNVAPVPLPAAGLLLAGALGGLGLMRRRKKS